MKNIFASIIIAIGITSKVNAQLPNGSVAPDFYLTDLDGTTHHLYDYLAEGKTVFIKFFACHCPTCWAYHNSGKLDSLYQLYGPSGTDQIMVLMLEHDEFNADAFYGLGGFTQGDWVSTTSVPMVDVEGGDRWVFNAYNMAYYPMVIKICPDKMTELMSLNFTVAELYQKADDCPGTLGIEEIEEEGFIRLDHNTQQLILENFDAVSSVTFLNTIGQEIRSQKSPENNRVDLSNLDSGLYFIRVESERGVSTKNVYWQ